MKNFSLLILFFIVVSGSGFAQEKVGWWKFDSQTDLGYPEIGNPLTIKGEALVATDGPSASNGAVTVAKGSYLEIDHNIKKNETDSLINQYSIVIDFKASELNRWYTFLQTDTTNISDGDLFINKTGQIGTFSTGYSDFVVVPGSWYRLAISADLGNSLKLYINGNLIHTANPQDANSRFSLVNKLLLFADNDGDDNDIDIAEITLYDSALTDVEVKELGEVSVQVDDADCVGAWNFDDPSDLLKAEVGDALVLTGSPLAVVDGPANDNGAVTVSKGTYFEVVNDVKETPVNQYSLVFDFRITKLNTWYTFFQTDTTNGSDGDLFINKTGNIGTYVTGYSDFAVEPGEWYRLVVSADLGNTFKFYLDGNLIRIANKQNANDRFSLEKKLLLLADNDGDDGNIDIAEISLYSKALSDQEVLNLGGYGHTSRYVYDIPVLKPYLQTPAKDYMYISWHDTSLVKTIVNYGTTETLGSEVSGSYETIGSYPYLWHTVKLTGLTPDTKYYYQLESGSGISPVYSFKTQPEENQSNGHIRFLIFSDTQQNPNISSAIVNSSITQMKKLFGDDYADSLNFVLHTGDINQEGNEIGRYTKEYFSPFEMLSCRLPFIVTPGNHERESNLFYSYMKYDEVSPFSTPVGIAERFWSFNVARSLFIGLNSNIVYTFGEQEKQWFKEVLQGAEEDPQIDQVFCFIHHCPYSELWSEGESSFSQEIVSIMQRFSKVRQLAYGHTHAYEMGTVPSLADNASGDVRLACVGGGGGNRDYFSNSAIDIPFVNMSCAKNFFVYADIDVEKKSSVFSVYSAGDLANNPVPNISLLDTWYYKLKQEKPKKPLCASVESKNDSVFFLSSPYSGSDSLMTTELQVSSVSNDFSSPIIESSRDWRNIFGIDGQGNPLDINKNIDLLNCGLLSDVLVYGTTYYWRVRYRDHNVKWSDWSEEQSFILDKSTSVNTLNNDSEIKIVNPMKDNLIVLSENHHRIERIIIYDLSGKMRLDLINPKNNSIDVSSLREGVYVVGIDADGVWSYVKCVKIQ